MPAGGSRPLHQKRKFRIDDHFAYSEADYAYIIASPRSAVRADLAREAAEALHPYSPFRDRLAKHRGKIYLAEAGSNVAYG